MSWKLFLDDDCDDVRDPKITVENPTWRKRMDLPSSVPDTSEFGEWVLARNADAAITLIEERGMPAFISFDHDLRDGKDGIAVAHWLTTRDMDGDIVIPKDFRFEVHSGNRTGRENIRCLIENYLAFRTRESALKEA